jgi:ligand-binding sensor domain-containing protein
MQALPSYLSGERMNMKNIWKQGSEGNIWTKDRHTTERYTDISHAISFVEKDIYLTYTAKIAT